MVKEYYKKIKELGIGKLLLILLAGILLVVSGVNETADTKKTNEVKTENTGSNSSDLACEMEQILRKIDGVEEVEVMVTYENTGEKILVSSQITEQSNLNEQDSQGGIRSETTNNTSEEYVYMGETPYVVMEKKPKVCGVLVVYKGSSTAATNVTEAVKVLTDVDYNHIKVLLMN